MSEELSAKDVYTIGVLFEKIDNYLFKYFNPKEFLKILESILKKSEHFKKLSEELRIWIKILEEKNDKLGQGEANTVQSDIQRIRGYYGSILDDRFNVKEI